MNCFDVLDSVRDRDIVLVDVFNDVVDDIHDTCPTFLLLKGSLRQIGTLLDTVLWPSPSPPLPLQNGTKNTKVEQKILDDVIR